jgi:exodeoxyribonuclease VII large subunit
MTVERRRERFDGAALRLRAGVAANLAAQQASIARQRERVGALGDRGVRAIDNLIDARWARCERDAQLLAAFSYRGVLARGFALVRDKMGRPLRTASSVAPAAALDIEFSDGRIGAQADAQGASLIRPSEPRRSRRRRVSGPEQGNLF